MVLVVFFVDGIAPAVLPQVVFASDVMVDVTIFALLKRVEQKTVNDFPVQTRQTIKAVRAHLLPVNDA